VRDGVFKLKVRPAGARAALAHGGRAALREPASPTRLDQPRGGRGRTGARG
jgi:hypothetical protein